MTTLTHSNTPSSSRSRQQAHVDSHADRRDTGALASLLVTGQWKHTALGRAVFFLGGIRFAVPLLIAVAAVMAWATFIESANGSAAARSMVYGSWWFIGMMALVCASLIAAVATRWPWRRVHVGFITVHASLVLLIVGGFISLFTRVEGMLRLEEGQVSSVAQQEGLELRIAWSDENASPESGGQTIERFPIDSAGHRLRAAGGLTVTVDQMMPNARLESSIINDGASPFEAFYVSLARPDEAASNFWISETMGPVAHHFDGVALRTLAPAAPWMAPAASNKPTPFFEAAGNLFGPIVERRQALPGWWVVSIEQIDIDSSDVVDASLHGDPFHGPGVVIVITDGKATFERHTASLDRPSESYFERLAGKASSGAALRLSVPEEERITLQAVNGLVHVGYANARTGEESQHERAEGELPFELELGGRTFRIERHFAHAMQSRRLVEVPADGLITPGMTLTFEAPGAPPKIVELLYRQPTLIRVGDRTYNMLLASREMTLPFAVRLEDFRRVDYPGEQMAMAYESDVSVHRGDGEWDRTTVSMNRPLKLGGWKVYQSSYIGDTISIFSVMKDPGLPVIYIACIGLCIGVAITFYSRSLSRGHPGISRRQGAAS